MSINPHLGEFQLIEKILRFNHELSLPILADQLVQLIASSESKEDLARIRTITDLERIGHKQQKNRDQC